MTREPRTRFEPIESVPRLTVWDKAWLVGLAGCCVYTLLCVVGVL